MFFAARPKTPFDKLRANGIYLLDAAVF